MVAECSFLSQRNLILGFGTLMYTNIIRATLTHYPSLSSGDDPVSYLVSGRHFRSGGQSPILQVFAHAFDIN